MALGLLLGMAARYAAPKIAGEAAASGASHLVGKYAANRLANFAAGSAGQRMIGQALGTRAAKIAASETGQKVGKYLVTKEIRSGLQGEGRFAEQPKTKIVSPNRDYDASNQNLVAGNNINQAQMPGQGGRQNAGKQGSGWMGSGKGWWEQNEQVSQKAALRSDAVVNLGDFSAARGPATWGMVGGGLARKTGSLAIGAVEGFRATRGAMADAAGAAVPEAQPALGRGAGRTSSTGRPASHAATGHVGTNPTEGTGAKATRGAGPQARRAGFSQGAGATQDADVVEHTLTNVTQSGRGSEVTLADTAGTYRGMGTQVGASPPGRLSNFSAGTGELGTGPLAIGAGPASAPKRRQAGMGQYGRDRFRSMMADVGY